MKHLFKILAIAFIGLFIISCEKDEDQAVITETTKSAISPDKTTLVLDKNNPDNVALNVVWNKSTFNLAVVSTQQLQFAVKGNNFAGATSVDAVSSPLTFTNKQLNSMALSLGGTPNAVIEIEVRLKTLIGAAPFYSNVATLKVTPYLLGPVYNFTDLYLIGDATAGGWDNTSTNTKIYPLQKSSTAGVYSYTGYFAQGGFKIIKTPGSWDTQYGMGSAGVLSTSGASGNITVAGSGYYKLTINTTALTYTFTAVPAPTTTYTSISMIGTASGDWSTDVDMVQSTFDPHVWVKKNVLLNSGEFKFRANHAWTTGWGVANEFFGVATTSGGNIPLTTSFHYDVYFNDITGEYSAIPVS
ncbi:SusF/SusE family outer membrane protein [Chryseobacterium soli]|uniref:SusF/SusE family outer membrane protein n=1 Tax=Chryseobacterium soli TaxID=445961 RepID=UPI002955675D|nr:SusF/SusE family outer membrane protein [Chryseobacterium soli]MDV7695356.1 SusF/SusE family outer membrane protein [Chryseobacterium soli]